MKRQDLFGWIDQTLNIQDFRDYSPIGLPVEGAPEITKVALGVSAHLALIEAAAAWGAEAILVHHGFFWPGESQVLTGWRKKRIKTLLMHDISLGGYHLPLDGHATLGNNAQLCDLMGVPTDRRQPFAKAKGAHIGLIGRYNTPEPVQNILNRVKDAFGDRLIFLEGGPEKIDTVAVVTGSGANYYEEARALGAQLFVTGEAREPTMAEALETNTSFLAAGHYNTETVGIKALGKAIEDNFQIETRFFDFPNPV